MKRLVWQRRVIRIHHRITIVHPRMRKWRSHIQINRCMEKGDQLHARATEIMARQHETRCSHHLAKHGLCSLLANSNGLHETGSRDSRKLMMSDAISATTITTMRCQSTTSQFSTMMRHVTLVHEYNIHGAHLLHHLNGINAEAHENWYTRRSNHLEKCVLLLKYQ